VNNECDNCFPCTGDPSNEEVEGLDGIFKAYEYALKNIEFSGQYMFIL